MISLITRYTQWLHTRWPAGLVEKLPEVGEGGTTALPGIRVVGDLTGIPLLKFSSDTGARAVQAILAEPEFPSQRDEDGVLDLAIIGGGVSGYAAAIEAKKAGLNFKLFESVQDFSTIANFPKGKPIYTYPTSMTPAGELQFKAEVKEALLEELEQQRKEHGITSEQLRVERIERKKGRLLLHARNSEPVEALRVIVAIGRSGNFRKLKVPGEDLDKVSNRLHDPKEFSQKQVLVVGGGDSALEAAIALVCCGAHVTLSYRKHEFSRPKPDNIDKLRELGKDAAFPTGITTPSSERTSTAANSEMRGDNPPGSLKLLMGSRVKEITPTTIQLESAGEEPQVIDNDQVFVMTGREAPLGFFRRSGLAISGEWRKRTWVAFLSFFAFCLFLFHWKSGGWLNSVFQGNGWFPFNLAGGDTRTLLGSLLNATKDPGFYYSLAYCLSVVIFGIRRIRRRKTPYIKRQTLTLMAFQVIPLFILPYLLLPWMGSNGVFESGFGKWVGDVFFPDASYWRSFGFILAWPLFIWNVFTDQPVWGWLILSLIQTFVIIPLIVRRWGKGAYCGWVCSCGALAETLGDAHRQKMPHGPFWNRLNMVGQVVLGAALILLVLRVIGWIFPGSFADSLFAGLLSKYPVFNYKYLVDLWLAGILGVTFYFHFSGRIWCRFACPLAALMHIYARFSQFRIFADKKKCISCNVCTSVCHQGIDVMNFANKGMPMEDPQCVRCSACVQSCPTGVLSFGRYNGQGSVRLDQLVASPVHMKESVDSLNGFLKDIKSLRS
ncbi:MAG: NAD(P)-binding domain-containing protein [Verrucomicrobia bacterium]|nr:NAD(P)-binding domain-containing protein [Verrucomicrobiota bacterium]